MSVDVSVLADLARSRRRRRVADVDLFEKLYQAYLSVIAVGIVLLVGASLIGDEPVGRAALERARLDGAGVVGLLAAVALVAGLRSGARGGPMTLEAPFIAHVLLSPLPRDRALRDPALRQLVQGAVVGGALGGFVGVLASHRLSVASAPLVLWAVLGGATTGAAAVGAAMVAAGLPVPKPAVHALSLLLVGGSVADVAASTAWSPGSWFGRLAVGGLELHAPAALAPATATALAAGGLAVVGGTSMEAARRRAGLVSQLRLAVTRQDLRTVVLLQRRLAQDAARRRPWVRIPPGRHVPVFRRGLRSLARLPLVRVVRVFACCSIAVAAAVGTWRGTTPLVVACGLALWAAGLDLIEPLAQELDHPDRWAGYPVAPGDLLTRHLVAPGLALALVTCVPLAVLGALGDTGTVLQTAAGVLLPACAGATLGAAASIATAPFDPGALQTAMPEAVGTQLIFRVAWPPAVAVLAVLPLLAAREAHLDGLAELPAATQYLLPVFVLLGIVSVWLSRRKPEVT